MQCSSDYRPCVCTRGEKENKGVMGNDSLYLSMNFVQISSTVLKTLASFRVLEMSHLTVKNKHLHILTRMNNLSPTSVRESDIPPPPAALHTNPRTSISSDSPIVMYKKCAKVQESPCHPEADCRHN